MVLHQLIAGGIFGLMAIQGVILYMMIHRIKLPKDKDPLAPVK